MDVDLFSIKSSRVILTGGRGSGKTRACLHWVEQARQANWTVAGMVCPAVFERGEKAGFDAVNLATSERRRLANQVNRDTGDIVTDHWDFFADVLAWGNDVLRSIEQCDLLIIDELGPLEFNRRQGWVNGFNALDHCRCRLSVVVIRPELLADARGLWPHAEIIDLDA
jgi:nucleoside-triphosphatase